MAQKHGGSIGFIENKGQIVDQQGHPNPAVKYLLNTPGLNVQLRENGFSYDVYETEKQPEVKGESPIDKNHDLSARQPRFQDDAQFVKKRQFFFPQRINFICIRLGAFPEIGNKIILHLVGRL